MDAIDEKQPIIATDTELLALDQIESALKKLANKDGAKIVGPNNEQIELPASVVRALTEIVRYLAQGQIVTVVPLSRELTTQEAADLLNMSRPYLIKLLEQGAIPFSKTGAHRRIKFTDAMDYKKRRDAKRRRSLEDLIQISQEAGLYEE